MPAVGKPDGNISSLDHILAKISALLDHSQSKTPPINIYNGCPNGNCKHISNNQNVSCQTEDDPREYTSEQFSMDYTDESSEAIQANQDEVLESVAPAEQL